MTPPTPDAVRANRRDDRLSNRDVRAIRTRHSIVEATRALLREEPDDIAVSAVCELAGVTRSAFYSHFANVHEVAVAAVSDIVEAIATADVSRRKDAGLSSTDASQTVMGDLLHAAREHPEFRWVLRGPSAEARLRLTELVALQARATLEQIDYVPDHVDLDVASTFITAGTMSVLANAVASDGSHDDDLIQQISASLPHWLFPSPA